MRPSTVPPGRTRGHATSDLHCRLLCETHLPSKCVCLDREIPVRSELQCGWWLQRPTQHREAGCRCCSSRPSRAGQEVRCLGRAVFEPRHTFFSKPEVQDSWQVTPEPRRLELRQSAARSQSWLEPTLIREPRFARGGQGGNTQ